MLQAKRAAKASEIDPACTFSPAINKSKSRLANESGSQPKASERLYAAALQQSQRQKAASDAAIRAIPFKPTISEGSKKLSNKVAHEGPIHEVLYRKVRRV